MLNLHQILLMRFVLLPLGFLGGCWQIVAAGGDCTGPSWLGLVLCFGCEICGEQESDAGLTARRVLTPGAGCLFNFLKQKVSFPEAIDVNFEIAQLLFVQKMMKNTVHENDWFFYHDALSLMTCSRTVQWMREQGLCERWLTPLHFGKVFGRHANRPPGNSPELMPWDNSLNKDVKDALLFHSCLTHDELDEEDNLKFSLSSSPNGR